MSKQLTGNSAGFFLLLFCFLPQTSREVFASGHASLSDLVYSTLKLNLYFKLYL